MILEQPFFFFSKGNLKVQTGGYDQCKFYYIFVTLQVQKPVAMHKLNKLGFDYKQQMH
jgi:hypothetical protein